MRQSLLKGAVAATRCGKCSSTTVWRNTRSCRRKHSGDWSGSSVGDTRKKLRGPAVAAAALEAAIAPHDLSSRLSAMVAVAATTAVAGVAARVSCQDSRAPIDLSSAKTPRALVLVKEHSKEQPQPQPQDGVTVKLPVDVEQAAHLCICSCKGGAEVRSPSRRRCWRSWSCCSRSIAKDASRRSMDAVTRSTASKKA